MAFEGIGQSLVGAKVGGSRGLSGPPVQAQSGILLWIYPTFSPAKSLLKGQRGCLLTLGGLLYLPPRSPPLVQP